jgi:hypothetical protein
MIVSVFFIERSFQKVKCGYIIHQSNVNVNTFKKYKKSQSVFALMIIPNDHTNISFRSWFPSATKREGGDKKMEQENEFKRILTGKEYNQLMSIFKSITPTACEGTNFISHLAKQDISQCA